MEQTRARWTMADNEGVREIEIVVMGDEEGPLSPGSGAVIFLPSGDIRILLPGGVTEDVRKVDQPGSFATMVFAVMRAGLAGDPGPLGGVFRDMVEAFAQDFEEVTGIKPKREAVVAPAPKGQLLN